MKASEAYEQLSKVRLIRDDIALVVMRSRVDETKTLNQMLVSWLRLFEAYPDMRIGSILKYNINRDFDCL